MRCIDASHGLKNISVYSTCFENNYILSQFESWSDGNCLSCMKPGKFRLLNHLASPITWLQRNWLLLHFYNFFQVRRLILWCHQWRSFDSCFDETKTQDTDNSAKTKYTKEKECKTIRWIKANRKKSHGLWQY